MSVGETACCSEKERLYWEKIYQFTSKGKVGR